MEEAASGQGPTELVDAAPSPLNLPITYDGTNPTYKEISTGRGWESTTTNNQGRASILVDGTGGTDPPQNETISIPNGKNFLIANRELCCRSFNGDMYYAAYYNAALTAAEVSNNSNILLASDDSPP